MSISGQRKDETNGSICLVGITVLKFPSVFDTIGWATEGHLACNKPAPVMSNVLLYVSQTNQEKVCDRRRADK